MYVPVNDIIVEYRMDVSERDTDGDLISMSEPFNLAHEVGTGGIEP